MQTVSESESWNAGARNKHTTLTTSIGDVGSFFLCVLLPLLPFVILDVYTVGEGEKLDFIKSAHFLRTNMPS